ncbi:hypothetical protein Leryth_008483 [Lithospermum erythrorhizon]|nr:hypothetical protein Leryth_008483 [Lithospermum erythrorhizon]
METPEFIQESYYNDQFTPEKIVSDSKNVENFMIEDLLDFPNDDNNNDMVMDEAMFGNINKNNMTGGSGGASTDSSTATVFDMSCHSGINRHILGGGFGGCRSLPDGHFGSELCVPYDDLAELEWVSNFVEESFSSDDLQKMELISGVKARTDTSLGGIEAYRAIPTPVFRPEVSIPAKARSKRTRTAPNDWASRLVAISTQPNSATITSPMGHTMTPPTMSMSSSSESELAPGSVKKLIKSTIKKKENSESGGEGRRCLHCMTDKTPQWRTGPMGPKTLCNACGVRFKSGRLVPEYRPAASPTFVLAKHSNSHRKVLEIRRQKEVHQSQHQHQHQHQQLLQHGMMFDIPNGDDYLIHQNIGPNFRQLI